MTPCTTWGGENHFLLPGWGKIMPVTRIRWVYWLNPKFSNELCLLGVCSHPDQRWEPLRGRKGCGSPGRGWGGAQGSVSERSCESSGFLQGREYFLNRTESGVDGIQGCEHLTEQCRHHQEQMYLGEGHGEAQAPVSGVSGVREDAHTHPPTPASERNTKSSSHKNPVSGFSCGDNSENKVKRDQIAYSLKGKLGRRLIPATF